LNSISNFLKATERTPDKIDVTVYSGYNVQRFPNNMRVHYVKKDLLDLGIVIINSPSGFRVKVYNMERTICDILKDRNTGIDKEQTNKFIRNMIVHNQVDINKIWDYAKQLKCEKNLEKVMEWII